MLKLTKKGFFLNIILINRLLYFRFLVEKEKFGSEIS